MQAIESPPVAPLAIRQPPDCDGFLQPVSRAVARIAQQYRLSACDAEDLHSEVWLKLLANGRRALRRAERAPHVERYVTRIARNLLFDQRRREFGRIRRTASRGTPAVSSRQFVGATELDRQASATPSPLDALEAADHQRDAARLRQALQATYARLDRADRALIAGRYAAGHTIAGIAQRRAVGVKQLYRRMATVIAWMRHELSRSGFECSLR